MTVERDDQRRRRDRERAEATYAAMQRHFYRDDGSSLYAETFPDAGGGPAYAYEWPFSQARSATLDLCCLPGAAGAAYRDHLRDRDAGQARYWSGRRTATGLPGYRSTPVAPYGAGGDLYYDDNAWVGLTDIQAHLRFGDVGALARAERTFALLISGWDADPTHAAPGGVYWTQARGCRDRNTVSNMPAAELGLRIYRLTRDRSALAWATRMYEWTTRHLLAPNGLYWDHISLAGTVETTQWSYNQGVPVVVNLLLAECTGDAAYRRRAERLAEDALAFYGDALDAQPPHFNAIFFKRLLALAAPNADRTGPSPIGTRAMEAMRGYADRAWERARDPNTGLFQFGDGGTTQLLEQAAMSQIYAVLAWDPADYRLLS